MERRSFLASLAALFVARKLPQPPPASATYSAELSFGSREALYEAGHVRLRSYRFDWDERKRRYVQRVPPVTPDVWGNDADTFLTITTTP